MKHHCIRITPVNYLKVNTLCSLSTSLITLPVAASLLSQLHWEEKGVCTVVTAIRAVLRVTTRLLLHSL